LREEESPILPGEGREEEGLGSLSGLFLYHLELGGWETKCHHLAPLTCELGEELLSQEGEANLPQTPLEEQYPKSSFLGLLRMGEWSILGQR
jgi:hypothetical protein